MSTFAQDIKKEFPIFQHHPNMVYLDSAATALKPQCVIDAMNKYYTEYSANVHRGIYALSNRATAAYEQAREDVAAFIGGHPSEIIFTRNATEAINLVAQSWLRHHLSPSFIQTSPQPSPTLGEGVRTTIGLSIAEHHSNIVPWQQIMADTSLNPSSRACPELVEGRDDDADVVASPPLQGGVFPEGGRGGYSPLERGRRGVLCYLEVDANGELVIPNDFFNSINFLTLTHVSNVLGTINPIKEIIKKAHQHNVPVLIDASQSIPHIKVDVGDLDCDFLVFSGHKLGGPTGIGVLYAKSSRMKEMEPFLTGGDMIKEVHRDYSVWNDAPHKFEAGTPHIAGAIGLGVAVNWLRAIGWGEIRKHEEKLLEMLIDGIGNTTPSPLRGATPPPGGGDADVGAISPPLQGGVSLEEGRGGMFLGPRDFAKRSGLVSFNLTNIHPHDVAQLLDEQNICIRAGHHCAMPLHEYLGLVASCRASVWIYNTEEDVDRLVRGLKIALQRLK